MRAADGTAFAAALGGVRVLGPLFQRTAETAASAVGAGAGAAAGGTALLLQGGPDSGKTSAVAGFLAQHAQRLHAEGSTQRVVGVLGSDGDLRRVRGLLDCALPLGCHVDLYSPAMFASSVVREFSHEIGVLGAGRIATTAKQAALLHDKLKELPLNIMMRSARAGGGGVGSMYDSQQSTVYTLLRFFRMLQFNDIHPDGYEEFLARLRAATAAHAERSGGGDDVIPVWLQQAMQLEQEKSNVYREFVKLKRGAGVFGVEDLYSLARDCVARENVQQELLGRYRHLAVDDTQNLAVSMVDVLSTLAQTAPSGQSLFTADDAQRMPETALLPQAAGAFVPTSVLLHDRMGPAFAAVAMDNSAAAANPAATASGAVGAGKWLQPVPGGLHAEFLFDQPEEVQRCFSDLRALGSSMTTPHDREQLVPLYQLDAAQSAEMRSAAQELWRADVSTTAAINAQKDVADPPHPGPGMGGTEAHLPQRLHVTPCLDAEEELRHMSARIQHVVQSEESGNYGRVAVLCPQGMNVNEVQSFLSQEGVPVSSPYEGRTRVFDAEPVRVILSIFGTLLSPSQDAALHNLLATCPKYRIQPEALQSVMEMRRRRNVPLKQLLTDLVRHGSIGTAGGGAGATGLGDIREADGDSASDAAGGGAGPGAAGAATAHNLDGRHWLSDADWERLRVLYDDMHHFSSIECTQSVQELAHEIIRRLPSTFQRYLAQDADFFEPEPGNIGDVAADSTLEHDPEVDVGEARSLAQRARAVQVEADAKALSRFMEILREAETWSGHTRLPFVQPMLETIRLYSADGSVTPDDVHDVYDDAAEVVVLPLSAARGLGREFRHIFIPGLSSDRFPMSTVGPSLVPLEIVESAGRNVGTPSPDVRPANLEKLRGAGAAFERAEHALSARMLYRAMARARTSVSLSFVTPGRPDARGNWIGPASCFEPWFGEGRMANLRFPKWISQGRAGTQDTSTPRSSPDTTAFQQPPAPQFEQPPAPQFEQPSPPQFEQPSPPQFEQPPPPQFQQPPQQQFEQPPQQQFEQPPQRQQMQRQHAEMVAPNAEAGGAPLAPAGRVSRVREKGAPLPVTYRSLATFRKCAHAYYLEYVVGLTAPVQAKTHYDNTMRKCALFIVNKLRTGEVPTRREREAEFDKCWEEGLFGVTFTRDGQQDQLRKKGLNGLQDFQEMLLEEKIAGSDVRYAWQRGAVADYTRVPVEVDLPFDLDIDLGRGNLVQFSGRMDQVDVVQSARSDDQPSGPILVAYKSHMGKFGPEELIDSLELKMAAFAYEKKFGTSVDKVAMVSIEDGRQAARSITPDDLDRARKATLALTITSSKNEFKPRPSETSCRFCVFNKECEHAATSGGAGSGAGSGRGQWQKSSAAANAPA